MMAGGGTFYYLHTECLICKIYNLNFVNIITTFQPSELALSLQMDITGAEANLCIFPKLTSTELS